MTTRTRSLRYHILGTEDFRRKGGNFRYPAEVILTIAFLAYLCGARSSRKCETWGRENIESLRRHGMDLPYGIPSHHTFARFFEKMPPGMLKGLARRWGRCLADLPKGSVVALDGKALKHASKDGVHVPYNVSAWASERGFTLAERVTDEKSNEIAAMPKILDELGTSIAGCVVTIDAAGCQKAGVSHLRSSGHSLETHSGNTPGVDRLSCAEGWPNSHVPSRAVELFKLVQVRMTNA